MVFAFTFRTGERIVAPDSLLIEGSGWGEREGDDLTYLLPLFKVGNWMEKIVSGWFLSTILAAYISGGQNTCSS